MRLNTIRVFRHTKIWKRNIWVQNFGEFSVKYTDKIKFRDSRMVLNYAAELTLI
jgi:hypothetical protein